jgi:hypothetical protein
MPLDGPGGSDLTAKQTLISLNTRQLAVNELTADNVTVREDLTVFDDVVVGKDVFIMGVLDVSGNQTVGGNLTVGGNHAVVGDSTVGGTHTVTGATSLQGLTATTISASSVTTSGVGQFDSLVVLNSATMNTSLSTPIITSPGATIVMNDNVDINGLTTITGETTVYGDTVVSAGGDLIVGGEYVGKIVRNIISNDLSLGVVINDGQVASVNVQRIVSRSDPTLAIGNSTITPAIAGLYRIELRGLRLFGRTAASPPDVGGYVSIAVTNAGAGGGDYQIARKYANTTAGIELLGPYDGTLDLEMLAGAPWQMVIHNELGDTTTFVWDQGSNFAPPVTVHRLR